MPCPCDLAPARLQGPHVGLTYLWPQLEVLGDKEHTCMLTPRLAHGKELLVSVSGLPTSPRSFSVAIWGHPCVLSPEAQLTSSHMSYFLWEDECPNPSAMSSSSCPAATICTFSVPPSCRGNLLSVAGCSWHLESMAQQMYQSLEETLGTLPPEIVNDLSLPLPWGSSLPAQSIGCAPTLFQGCGMLACQPGQGRCGEGVHRRVLGLGRGLARPASIECLPPIHLWQFYVPQVPPFSGVLWP